MVSLRNAATLVLEDLAVPRFLLLHRPLQRLRSLVPLKATSLPMFYWYHLTGGQVFERPGPLPCHFKRMML